MADGSSCTANAALTLGFAGLAVAAVGVLVWGTSVGRTLLGDWTS
jgi:hypothetical protein